MGNQKQWIHQGILGVFVDSPRTLFLDLHGYSTYTATDLFRKTIEHAFNHGFEFVIVSHGGADIVNVAQAHNLHRGFIKFLIRKEIDDPTLRQYVYCRSSNRHSWNESQSKIAIKHNRSPKTEDNWFSCPPLDFNSY
jgi:hypothetical protein